MYSKFLRVSGPPARFDLKKCSLGHINDPETSELLTRDGFISLKDIGKCLDGNKIHGYWYASFVQDILQLYNAMLVGDATTSHKDREHKEEDLTADEKVDEKVDEMETHLMRALRAVQVCDFVEDHRPLKKKQRKKKTAEEEEEEEEERVIAINEAATELFTTKVSKIVKRALCKPAPRENVHPRLEFHYEEFCLFYIEFRLNGDGIVVGFCDYVDNAMRNKSAPMPIIWSSKHIDFETLTEMGKLESTMMKIPFDYLSFRQDRWCIYHKRAGPFWF